jgi:hypothetical protein
MSNPSFVTSTSIPFSGPHVIVNSAMNALRDQVLVHLPQHMYVFEPLFSFRKRIVEQI